MEDYGIEDTRDFTRLMGKDDNIDYSVYQFAKSPVLSCYLYSLIAGPYDKISSTEKDILSYKYPLGLYCRRSLTKYV